ncbi:MAG TPA: PAS domain-containing protein [Dehalococcoidales bacterium]
MSQTNIRNSAGNGSNKEKQSKVSISEVVKAGLKDPMFYRLYILGLLLFFCTLFYYFGEIVDYFKWDELRWDVFYVVHDVHRLLFLAPIIYAAHVFGLKATIIITLVSGGIWMPRAIFISPYPSPLLRAILFLVAEGGIGILTAMNLRQNRLIKRLEIEVRTDRDRLQDILKRMTDGVVIIGPDYKIKYANDAMKKVFGEGNSLPCYKYIYHYLEPCGDKCQLQDVIKGKTARWEYSFPDGTTYEVEASPCLDSEGVMCQLSTYRNITHLKKAQKV